MQILVENCEAGRGIEIEWNDDATAFLFKNLLDTITATDCLLAEPQFGSLLADDSFQVITKAGEKTTPVGLVSCYAACNHMKPATVRNFLNSRLCQEKDLGTRDYDKGN